MAERKIKALYNVCLVFKHISAVNEEFDKAFKSKLEEIIRLAKDNGVGVETNEFSEITAGLNEAVKQYFESHNYKGFVKPFKLDRVERSRLNPSFVYAVPVGIDEELEIDEEWEKGLAEVGEEYDVKLTIPFWCYSK